MPGRSPLPDIRPRLQAPAPPQVPVPEGIPAPVQELGHSGQRMLNQAQRSMNGVLAGGNPIVEIISGVQSAIQNIPLPIELAAQARRTMRDARFPMAEMGLQGSSPLPGFPGFPGGSSGTMAIDPGTPTGNRENPEEIPIF